ncbi:Y-family DNA polymerase [Pseudoroseomonas globiformis]|uniref:Y-family DNA polymerase n=1 Tax=Teichococcus globiformis TaxID=2307229 RepID=A0ABV7G1T7_9PROT
MPRFLALHLPCWETDLLRRAEPGLPQGVPLASWASSGSRRHLVAVDAVAAAGGLFAGQALADARALQPGLVLRHAAPEAEAAALRSLALWARRYTPLAAVDPPCGLLLDITGCAHLLGGEAELLQEARVRLARGGIEARGAVAGAAMSAGALARGRLDNPVVASGIEAEAVAPLGLGAALRLEQDQLLALARLGLRRVGDLQALPRGALARRFGTALLERLDAVSGQLRLALNPVLPLPELEATLDFAEPVTTRLAIDRAVDGLLRRLCARLDTAGRGARRITLLAWRVDGAVQELRVGTALAMRDPDHLMRLLAGRLERLEPGLGFERLVLEASATDPLQGQQQGFGPSGEAARREELLRLLDRLAQRVQVRGVEPLASHWPEHAAAPWAASRPPPAVPAGWTIPHAPVLLLRRPSPLRQDVPDDLGMIPLRVEPEWWHAPEGQSGRVYYRIGGGGRPRLWVFRSAGRWMVQGYLP